MGGSLVSYIEYQGLVVDSETGEVLTLPPGEDALSGAAWRRHAAKEQQKAWEHTVQTLDRVLMRQDTRKAQYGEVVVSVVAGSFPKTDVEAFVSMLSEIPLEAEEMADIIAAAKGFDRDKLPARVLEAFDDCTTKVPKAPYILTAPVLKQAPKEVPSEIA